MRLGMGFGIEVETDRARCCCWVVTPVFAAVLSSLDFEPDLELELELDPDPDPEPLAKNPSFGFVPVFESLGLDKLCARTGISWMASARISGKNVGSLTSDSAPP